MTKIRGPVLGIQTGKFGNCCVVIPEEDRTCLVCKQNQIKDEQHFLMFCDEYNELRQDLFNCIQEP